MQEGELMTPAMDFGAQDLGGESPDLRLWTLVRKIWVQHTVPADLLATLHSLVYDSMGNGDSGLDGRHGAGRREG